MKSVSLAVAALALAIAAPAAAQVINPSFESTPDHGQGWTAGGSGSVAFLTDADDATGNAPFFGEHYNATEGSFFAQLIAGPGGDYTTLSSQTFTLTHSATVSVDAAFLAFDVTSDGEGHNDDGFVSIFGPTLSAARILFSSQIDPDQGGVDDNGHTDWTTGSVVLAAGTYTLQAGVRNVGDTAFRPNANSELLVDNVAITAAPAPEPAAWALMILGFAGVGGALRRRRSAAAAA